MHRGKPALQIIPAVDLRGGMVVHAVAGNREAYQPLQSLLATKPQPAAIARGFVDFLGLTTLYVADLDAIAGGEPDWTAYRAMLDAGASLWIDAGLSDCASAQPLIEFASAHSQIDGMVAGLESLAGVEVLHELLNAMGPARTIFSLDLIGAEPRLAPPPSGAQGYNGGARGCDAPWRGRGAVEIAADVVARGVCRMIVLDVAAVGVGGGCPTLELCGQLRATHSQIELITGGGVRGPADLAAIAAAGCNGALVATALHDGRIGKGEIVKPCTRP